MCLEIDTQYYERFVDFNSTWMDKTALFYNENAVINNLAFLLQVGEIIYQH